MGAVSQGAAEAGGHTIGVTSSVVEASRDVSLNRWIREEVQYDSLQDRLYHLVTKNDGMVVLEGGVGTLSEISLAWSLLQVREIDEVPLILLGQLWKDTLTVFICEEYVSDEVARLITMLDSPTEVVEYLMSIRAGAK
jgi:predicted Rossmann-fold nucleotide-binding protein